MMAQVHRLFSGGDKNVKELYGQKFLVRTGKTQGENYGKVTEVLGKFTGFHPTGAPGEKGVQYSRTTPEAFYVPLGKKISELYVKKINEAETACIRGAVAGKMPLTGQ